MNLKNLFICAAAAFLAIAPATAQTKTHAHSAAHKDLLAKNASAKEQIKLIDKSSFVDLYDDVEPEIDIYTEGWNSRSVNPFKESDVPNTAVINVTGYCMPHNGRITSPYGYRARFGRMHKGVDIGLKMNDTIRAAFDGKIRLTNYEAKGYGNYVIIRHPNGLETVYGHLNKHLVKPNQVVKAGDPIGLGGNTGRSTGPHLHFETRYMGYAINPAAIFDFANHTTHTDTYTFSKQTYQQPRNFAPNRQLAKNESGVNPYSSAGEKTTYTVKKGDTLAAIARSYGLSATTLRKLNNMSAEDRIKVGQTLKLK